MEQTSGFVRVSSAPTNRGSTTFSARDPLHNDTFAVAFDDPFESMIRAKEKKDEKKKKLFRCRRCIAHHSHSIHPHPSIVDALARVPERFERGRTALESSILIVTKEWEG